MGGLETQSCHCRPWKEREVVVALKPELRAQWQADLQ